MPTEAWLYDQARFKVAEARRKLADRVRSEGREFKYATTETDEVGERLDAIDFPRRSRVLMSDEQRNRWKAFGEEVAKASSSEAFTDDADAEALEIIRRCLEEDDR
jgi:hypothetical protein